MFSEDPLHLPHAQKQKLQVHLPCLSSAKLPYNTEMTDTITLFWCVCVSFTAVVINCRNKTMLNAKNKMQVTISF